MENINNLVNRNLPHITTNTLILIIIAFIALYILIKVVSKIIKAAALIAICWFVLMSVQSTNIASIPVVKQVYNSIEKIIPSKELWTKASDYANEAKKINKAINDLNGSK